MRENYLSIQYLRAFAALLVVLHHTRNPHPWLFNPLEHFHGFAKGVDIFFVISGFIMAAIGSRETPKDFARKRLIRVAPIYWLATGLVLIQIARKDGLNDDLMMRFVMSILFIPHHDPNGDIFPILIPGWTLNYEMFFYGIFCVSLFSKKPIRNTFIALLALTGIGLLTGSDNPIYATYTSTKLTEFAAGLLIGANRHKIAEHPSMAILLPIGLVLLFTSKNWALTTLSSAMIVAAALAAEKHIPSVPAIKTLGDASYLIYISHHFTVGIFQKIWSKLPLDGPTQFYTLMLFTLVASCVIGVIGHFTIEKPLTKSLHRLFNNHRPHDNHQPKGQSTLSK